MREDWVEIRLGDLLEIERGGSPRPIKEYITTDEDGINWVKIGDTKGSKKYITKTYQKIKPSGLRKTRLVYPGDFVLSNSMSFGRPYIMGIKGAIHDGWLVLRDQFEVLDKNFLYHILGSPFVFNQFSKLAKGSTVKNLNIALVSEVKINLISAPEQRAIVAKIEELFSDLDKGIADLKKAQAQLKVYRQAVLSSSFSKNKSIELSQLVTKLSQGWSPKCINQNSTDENQWAVIKTSAIQSGKYIEHQNKILPATLEPREQHEIKTGDILITRAGPRTRVGICCLVRATRPKLINCDKAYLLKLDKAQVNEEYFEYVMNSPEVLSEIEVMKSGTSDSGLNLTQKAFLKLKIPFVSLKEQHQIVRKIESRLSVCDKVEQTITESLEKAQALRQSILKKAFAGNLLSAAEIEQCKQAPDYESASVLLAIIKAEKALGNSKGKKVSRSKKVKA